MRGRMVTGVGVRVSVGEGWNGDGGRGEGFCG